MAETIVWISGGAGGIGGGLARNQPYPDARVICLDVVDAPGFETVRFDLLDPASWGAVQASFEEGLASGAARHRFIHCAYAPIGKGLLAEVDVAEYQKSLYANLTGSISIASLFYRAVKPEHADAGLAVMTSFAAVSTLLGYSSYGASKAALERWAAIVANEVAARGWGPWVCAVRPGLVDTPTARKASELDPRLFPLGKAMQRDFERRGQDIDTAAKRLWELLSGRPEALVSL